MTSEKILKKMQSAASNTGRVLKQNLPGIRRAFFYSLADDAVAYRKNVCISIEEKRLLAVRGSTWLNRTVISDVREYPFEGGQMPAAGKLALAVSFALRDLKAEASGFTLIIPRSWSIITVADFPLTVRDTLSSAVEFELDRITPLSPAGAYYDFRVIGETGVETGGGMGAGTAGDARDRLEVMIAAAPAGLITPLLDSLRQNGIIPGRISVGLSAMGTCLGIINRKQNSIYLERWGDRYTGIETADGKIRRVFSGRCGRDCSPLVENLKLTGKASVFIRDEDLQLAAMLKASSTPFKSADQIEDGLRCRNKMRKPDGAALGGLLESLRPAENGLDLLTKGTRIKRSLPLAPTLLIAALLLAAAGFYYASPIYRDMRTVEEIEARIHAGKDELMKVESLKKETESLEKEISFISDFKSKTPLAINLLKELTAVIPKKAWLTRVKITSSTVDIEGQAPSATELLSILESSKFLKKVEFASPTMRDMKSNMDRFALKMEIENGL